MLNKQVFLTLTLSAALLAGCSTTHYINIVPQVDVKNESLVNDRVINVTTTSKLTNAVGSIETGLREKADIFTVNDVTLSAKESVIAGLRKLGFTPDQGLLPATEINIDITKMSYKTKLSALKTIATLEFEIKATVIAKGKTYKANYGSQKTEEYGTMPFQKTIEEDMNSLASQTVNRLLNDPNVIILLKQ